MRTGSILTAAMAGLLSLAFFSHEWPPTTGHAVAGIAVALPILLLIGLMTQPGESRDGAYRLLVVQVLVTGVASIALFEQRLTYPLVARLLPLLLFALPLAATARWIARPDASGPMSTDLRGRLAEIGKLPPRSQLAAVSIILVAAILVVAPLLVAAGNCSARPLSAGILDCVGHGMVASLNTYVLVVLAIVLGGAVYGRVLLSRMPPEVRATYMEARARARSQPDDAPLIAAELRRRVPAAYAPRLVRAVFLRAGLAKGMSLSEAVRYARIATERQLANPAGDAIAS